MYYYGMAQILDLESPENRYMDHNQTNLVTKYGVHNYWKKSEIWGFTYCWKLLAFFNVCEAKGPLRMDIKS